MKILNYDVKDKQSDYSRKSHLCLTGVLGCGASGSGKTNLLLDMIYRWLYTIYSYSNI